MRSQPIVAVLAAAAVLSAPVPAASQQPGSAPQTVPAPPPPLPAEIRADIVDTVAAEMIRFYAAADTGQMIADHLRKRLRAGAYDQLTDPRLFAEAVSIDMRAINHDRHLALVPQRIPNMLPLGTPRLQPSNGPQQTDYPPAMLEAARRTNYGLGRIEILPGNIGYFQINGFSSVAGPAQDAIVDGLKYLAGTDAVIFDLRENGGGLGYLSNMLISHFVGDDSVHVLDVDIRSSGQKMSRYTMAKVPGPRRPTVPVYVLIGRGTVSAGEDFAFVMKNLGRATLVGESTAGAGRNNRFVDAGHGFAASISISRVTDPKTGAEWEGTGVIPNVRTSFRGALTEAQELALSELAAKATDPIRRREYELTKEYVAAQANPHAMPSNVLTKYEGRYGGQRIITVENGKLIFRLDSTRVGAELAALDDSTFALGPTGRLRFERDAKSGYRMVSIPVGGEPLLFARTGPPPAIPSEYRIEPRNGLR